VFNEAIKGWTTRSGSKGKGGAVKNVHGITKFDLEEKRSNDRRFKVLIIHRRAERF